MFEIIACQETIYFGEVAGVLRQWLTLTVASSALDVYDGVVTITAGEECVSTPLRIAPGTQEYRCYAPVRWPQHPPVAMAPLTLTVGGEVLRGVTSVGTHRPWKIYLLSDVCTDYTWAYEDAPSVRRDDADLLEAELTAVELTGAEPEANRNHYNLVHSREVEFYLEHYPRQAARLFHHLRDGAIGFNPLYNMCLTSVMSLEEQIRHLYLARALARKYGLDLRFANHQETPTTAWGFISVLAGSGVKYLVAGILPYQCPWAARLEEPPLYYWEGPDGGRVLVRRNNDGYAEGNFIVAGFAPTLSAIQDVVAPQYESYADRYPFDAIALVGCYGDLHAGSKDKPAKKVATIQAYNAQEWQFPLLINASHRQFWDDIETQIAARRISVPVYRGDAGAAWDAWPMSLAHDAAAWRRAQERAVTADALLTLVAQDDPAWADRRRDTLRAGWQHLLYLADHAWNGANDAGRLLNAQLRRHWQQAANQALDGIINEGLRALGARIRSGEHPRVIVFNALGWTRTAVAAVPVSSPAQQVIDPASGAIVPSQYDEKGSRRLVTTEVPSLGYRILELRDEMREAALPSPWMMGEYTLDGPYYSLEISPQTGGIVRLYDKLRGREMVDAASPYQLGQCLFLSDEVEYTPTCARVAWGERGPVSAQCVLRSSFATINLTTTFTLYAELDRLDIRYDVEKPLSMEGQELNFVFPLNVPERQYRVETSGCLLTPGVDSLPGAALSVTPVRHCVDTFNTDYGILLSQSDSFLVEFGHRTTLEDVVALDTSNSTLFVVAFGNRINYQEVTRDQGGQTRFTFRYSLRGHAGGCDPVAVVRFGSEQNQPLLACAAPGEPDGTPATTRAFVRVAPDNLILTCVKHAEEGGVIFRLWECAGRETTATIDVSDLGTPIAAERTDLLERSLAALPLTGGTVTVTVPGYGISTVRVQFVGKEDQHEQGA